MFIHPPSPLNRSGRLPGVGRGPVFKNVCQPAQVRTGCSVEWCLMQKVRLTLSRSNRVHRVQGHFSPLSSRCVVLYVLTNNLNVVPNKAAGSQIQTLFSSVIGACVTTLTFEPGCCSYACEYSESKVTWRALGKDCCFYIAFRYDCDLISSQYVLFYVPSPNHPTHTLNSAQCARLYRVIEVATPTPTGT